MAPTVLPLFSTTDLADFRARLAGIPSAGSTAAQIRINSVGGSWLEAQSIYVLIRTSGLVVDTYNDGLVADAASLVLQAGRTRYMSVHARLLLTECSGSAAGQIADIQKAIDAQRAINESAATVYATRSGLTLAYVREMMRAQTWLSAQQAKELGLIDVVVLPEPVDQGLTAAARAAAATTATAAFPLTAAGVMAEIRSRTA